MNGWRDEEQRIRGKQPFRALPRAQCGFDWRVQKDLPPAWSICTSVAMFFVSVYFKWGKECCFTLNGDISNILIKLMVMFCYFALDWEKLREAKQTSRLSHMIQLVY